MSLRSLWILFSLLFASAICDGQAFQVESPNKRNVIRIETGPELKVSVLHDGAAILEPSPISLTLGDGTTLGHNSKLRSEQHSTSDTTFVPAMYAKRQLVRDHFNQLELAFDGGYTLVLRAYDDGVTYRWRTNLAGELKITSEQASFKFSASPLAYLQIPDCAKEEKARGADCFHFSYENTYTAKPLAEFSSSQIAVLPVLIAPASGSKVLITESDLLDYPGMWFSGSNSGKAELNARFPAYPLEEKIVGKEFPQRVVSRRADFIAQTHGTRLFPWRVFVIADSDKDLIDTDIVFRLGGETPPGDWSWLKPGKNQSEWLQDNHLYGVDFRAGYNFDTYKYYADFDARFRLGYFFCDAGWSEVTNPLKLTPAMRVEELIRYAQQKQLGVALWLSSVAVETQMIPIFDQLQRWGVNGVMVDFMDRDDQKMVNFYERVAQEAAKRRMFVNFHGAYKPTGLERRYPNLLTREAVKASEYFKWSDDLTPEFETTVPFIRMVAGALDYEPGFMKNAQKSDFRTIGGAPMSMGTRMHQVAMYVVYESPYAKLGGNVSDYLREPEITQFMAGIPTVWKETRALDAKVADYAVVARQVKNGDFYVGALTDWSPRDLDLDLSFLGAGTYRAEIYADGINADQYGIDFMRTVQLVKSTQRLKIKLAPGGGWVGHFTQLRKR